MPHHGNGGVVWCAAANAARKTPGEPERLTEPQMPYAVVMPQNDSRKMALPLFGGGGEGEGSDGGRAVGWGKGKSQQWRQASMIAKGVCV